MVAVIEKIKTITVKIIGNERKTILLSSDRFRRLPYLTGNLPSVITDTTHTLGPASPHPSMSNHPHMQAHKVILDRLFVSLSRIVVLLRGLPPFKT